MRCKHGRPSRRQVAGKGLAAAFDHHFDALEAYGMSCEDEMSLLRETDLSTLDMLLNPLQDRVGIPGSGMCVCACTYSGPTHTRILLVLVSLLNTGVSRELQLTLDSITSSIIAVNKLKTRQL